MGFLLLTLTVVLLSATPLPGAPSAGALTPRATAVNAASAPAMGIQPLQTHGDLVVDASNSPYVIAPGPNATSTQLTYYEQGNVTVRPGGSLIVRNTTIVFEQFVASTGSIAQRLSHLYSFTDQGSVTMVNSTLTIDPYLLNAFTKLWLNVSSGGTFEMTSGTLGFAGGVTAYGAGSSVTLNSVLVAPSSATGLFTSPLPRSNQTISNDTAYAPNLAVLGGARMTLTQSQVLGVYADNVSAHGMPGPSPIVDTTSTPISSAGGASFSGFALSPIDSENLTRSVLYPSISGGSLAVGYSSPFTEHSVGTNQLAFGGTAGLSGVTYAGTGGVVTVPLSTAAVGLINAQGVDAFLAAADAGQVSVDLGATNSTSPVTITSVALVLRPALSFNVTADGAGSVFTAADSVLGLNWNLTPGTPVTGGTRAPTPWGSNKLTVTDGAAAFLANDHVLASIPSAFWNQSIAVPDAASTVNVYRWFVVPVTGAGGQPVLGAQTQAFYAYNATATLSNATATQLNALGTADPDLAAYVSAFDAAHGISAYGASSPSGDASLLLASAQLTQATLPDGTFLGDYHVAATAPNPRAGGTEWFYATLTPFPTALTTAAGQDTAPAVNYPNYRPLLSATSVSVSVNAQANSNSTVAIGQELTVTVLVSNVGTGSVNNFSASFWLARPAPLPPVQLAASQSFGALAPGANQSIAFTWQVNETTVGYGEHLAKTFLVDVIWNGGVGPNAGALQETVPLTVVPSYISFTWAPATGQLNANEAYSTKGTIQYNGSGDAIVNVTATSSSNSYFLGSTDVAPGNFSVEMFLPALMQNGEYTVHFTAYYNHRTVYQNYTSAFLIGPPPAGPGPWYTYVVPVLGLQLWLLIVILGIAAAAIVAAMMLLRQQARGKLVECGECGELIPESAPACPKCGAEFEANLVRCSRCGSTIPADSKVCPDCAAQLLGKGEPATRDPERQGYSDFVERYRTEAKKELQDNYSEGAFWDWWKRQPSYISFNQWRLQQAQGSRAGMAAPQVTPVVEAPAAQPQTVARRAAPAGGMPPAARAPQRSATARPGPVSAPPVATSAQPQPIPESAPGAAPMKACSNCGKEIPPEYLVCPFCGAVTQ